jgi:hypothetical protein
LRLFCRFHCLRCYRCILRRRCRFRVHRIQTPAFIFRLGCRFHFRGLRTSQALQNCLSCPQPLAPTAFAGTPRGALSIRDSCFKFCGGSKFCGDNRPCRTNGFSGNGGGDGTFRFIRFIKYCLFSRFCTSS